MAEEIKLPELVELLNSASDDIFYVVDKSDHTDGPDGSSKFITCENLFKAITLNMILTNSNESQLPAKIGELFLYDAAGSAYGKVTINDGVFRAYDKDGKNIFQCENSIFSLLNGTFEGAFDISAITANHTWAWPDKSGTPAMLDDIIPFVASEHDLDDFVNASPNPFIRADAIVATTTYNTKFSYLSGEQEFEVPNALKILDIRLNKAPLDLTDDYTVNNGIVTIIPALEFGDQIVIIGII